MAVTIKANNVIDSLLADFDDMEEFYRTVPRGSYIGETSPYRAAYNKCHKAEQRINLVSDVLGISNYKVYSLIHIARKWYLRTEWQHCLPDQVADRLLEFLINQK